MSQHPYKQLHREAERVLEGVLEERERLHREREEIERRLGEIRERLSREHGPGYITIKWVRNKRGKRYTYAVYRTLGERREIYLGEEALEMLRRLREIRERLGELSRAEAVARMYLRITRPWTENQ